MDTYEFTVTLNRVPAEDDFDRLFEAGLDDSTPEIRDGRGVLNVHRESASLSAAILSAVADIERAGFEAVSITDEDLVSLKTVAQRLGARTRACASWRPESAGPETSPLPYPATAGRCTRGRRSAIGLTRRRPGERRLRRRRAQNHLRVPA
jgi:hypothetical protein